MYQYVYKFYYHEGREGSEFCRELKPGIAVIVEGSEIGEI